MAAITRNGARYNIKCMLDRMSLNIPGNNLGPLNWWESVFQFFQRCGHSLSYRN